MLSAVGLGAYKLQPSKFSFNFTPPSTVPQMPSAETSPSSNAPEMAQASAESLAESSTHSNGKSHMRKYFGIQKEVVAKKWKENPDTTTEETAAEMAKDGTVTESLAKEKAQPKKRGKKRARNGNEKPPPATEAKETSDAMDIDLTTVKVGQTQTDGEVSKDTPATTPKRRKQGQRQDKATASEQPKKDNGSSRKKQKVGNEEGSDDLAKDQDQKERQEQKSQKGQPKSKKQKLPRLPINAIVSKRPILRPAIPTPFSSSDPKIIYVKAATKFVPTIKLVRKLLGEISKRQTQSLIATGTLTAPAVEQAIADASSPRPTTKEAEPVLIKGTGKAIPVALNLGLFFQKQVDCKVQVEAGTVKVIDDIALKNAKQEEQDEDDDEDEDEEMSDDEANADTMFADEKKLMLHKQHKIKGKQEKKRKFDDEAEVPETRIRFLSSVTVAISLK
ncbi:uncharacterized protein BDR25DRAFT_339484 [Lindgomyces ingoldianus]|uniref:Uncharacterized protein n=1 Tax=Lindgomyces ingoldianus TaxID=673940 RepID=A0ACB6RB44_9PLEO|nr:uncharacterized protein BDR25DRAFT_339484 [Lindgomyces ingoldianus]KAF2476489.1 hypothetical protein BDR25DRAFT_339484 [Lindgomyces ingoldianus]